MKSKNIIVKFKILKDNVRELFLRKKCSFFGQRERKIDKIHLNDLKISTTFGESSVLFAIFEDKFAGC